MKKRTVFAACALAVVLGLGVFAGCSANMGDVADPIPQPSVRELTALDGYTVSNMDGLGLIRASAQNESTLQTDYVLYDVTTDTIVHSDVAFVHVADGLYYTEETDGSVAVFTVYGRGGQVRQDTYPAGETAPFASGSTITCLNGDVLYVSPGGRVKTAGADSPTPFARYGAAVRAGDVYLTSASGGAYHVFDASERYLRTVKPMSKFSAPEGADGVGWIVGSRYFIQVYYAVPDSENDYDFTLAATDGHAVKYRLETYYYDFASDSTGTVDLKFLVTGAENTSDFLNSEYAVLYGQEILDGKQVAMNETARIYDRDGGLYVDVQDMFRGANDVTVGAGSVLLSDGAVEKYYFEGKEIYSLPQGTADARYGAYYRVGDTVYNENGRAVFTLPDGASIVGSADASGGSFYYLTEGGTASEQYLSVWTGKGSRELGKVLDRNGTVAYLVGESADSCSLYALWCGTPIFEDLQLDAADFSMGTDASGENVEYTVFSAESGGAKRTWLLTERTA